MTYWQIRQPTSELYHYGVKGMKWGIRRTPEQLGHKKKPKNIKNAEYLPNYKGKMYFISQTNMSNKILRPRIPDNYFTKNGYEDSETPRVSFADSVDGCLKGMSYNVKGIVFNVYEPADRSDILIYRPNTRAVPDRDITGELWVTSPVKLNAVGQIRCVGDDGKDGIPFTYGNGKRAELYGWNWEWIKQ